MNLKQAREKIRNHTGPSLVLQGRYYSKLKRLPGELANLKGLESLNLSGNRLTTLPKWFPQLKSLQTLDLSENSLKTLPDWFPQLENLHALDLSSNRLSTLPDWFPQFTNLQTLNISYIGLKTLPDWFPQLENLQALDLSSNILETLPDWLPQLKDLQTLGLRCTFMSRIPDCLSQLESLHTLDLSDNRLETLPDCLSQLENLQTLNLHGLNLQALPDCLSQLKNLQTLDLSNNLLETLPDWLPHLENLQTLYLRENGLKTLPDWFCHFLTNLQTLDLSENPLDIPSIFLQPNIDHPAIAALFTYLKSRHQDPHPKATFQIPKELRTAFKQYFLFFKDYLESFKGLDVELDVASTETGLEIILKGATEHEFDEINRYLKEFLSLTKSNIDQQKLIGAGGLDEIRLNHQIRHLQTELEFAHYKMNVLEKNNEEKQETIIQLASADRTINVNLPKIVNQATASATAQANPEINNTVNIDLKIEIPNLQDTFAELRQALPKDAQDQTAALLQDVNKLSTTATKEEIEKSGVLSGIRQFFKKIEDAESGLSKALATGKKGIDAAQKLGRAYNSIAQWVGLPQVPTPFLGKGD